MIGKKPLFLGLKVFMAFIYLSLGVVILFSNKLLFPVTGSVRPWLGALLIIYGLFRIYSVFINSKRDEAN